MSDKTEAQIRREAEYKQSRNGDSVEPADIPDEKILAVSSADIDKIVDNPKLKILSARLKSVAQKFDALKKAGMDEEILVIFIQDRTGLAKGKIKEMLKAQDEFFAKLLRRSL